jgi:hypothetical protein
MGHQFIQQPNGKWAIWSSVVDDFIWLDCEEWDLFSAEAFDRIESEYHACKRDIERTKDPEAPKRWTQMTWEEALAHRKEVHSRRKGFNEDPFAELPVPELDAQPKMESVDDFFRLKLSQVLEFYYWFKKEHEEKGWDDPPPHFDQRNLEEPRRTALRHKHTLQHYESLLGLFIVGKFTNPLCPHCKKIVDEEGEVCEACEEYNRKLKEALDE